MLIARVTHRTLGVGMGVYQEDGIWLFHAKGGNTDLITVDDGIFENKIDVTKRKIDRVITILNKIKP